MKVSIVLASYLKKIKLICQGLSNKLRTYFECHCHIVPIWEMPTKWLYFLSDRRSKKLYLETDFGLNQYCIQPPG